MDNGDVPGDNNSFNDSDEAENDIEEKTVVSQVIVEEDYIKITLSTID